MPPVVRSKLALSLGTVLASSVLLGCGLQVEVASNTPDYRAANLFKERCSGCHSLDTAASKGSAPPRQNGGGERTNGPNFNQRQEAREDVLYAIRNGGFSGAIMPANIVSGDEAELLADFVAKYAGKSGPTDP